MKRLTATILAATAWTAGAALGARPPAPGDSYVVYAARLDLRENPSAEAPVVGTLNRGARVTVRSAQSGTTGWLAVTAEGKEGWLAGKDVLPADLFDGCAEADRLARGGDAAAMQTALVAAYDRLTEYPADDGDRALYPSPDGTKAVLVLHDYVLYVAAGKGLADSLGTTWTNGGGCRWAPDSRFFAYYAVPEVTSPLLVYDCNRGAVVFIAPDCSGEYELVGPYVVWFGGVEIKTAAEEGVTAGSAPSLNAYDVDTGQTLLLLTPDPATLEWYEERYRARLVPATPDCPAVLKETALYRKYENQYAFGP